MLRLRRALMLAPALALAVVPLASCSSTGAKGAAEGAAIGAAAGAVGGMLTAVIFGGDVGGAAARGAAYGAGAGAVTGGIRGEQQHAAAEKARRAEAQSERQAQLERLRVEIGEDAYQGLEALTDRKYEVAIAYARTAARSEVPDHALAGLWLEALVYADSERHAEAEALLPRIVAADAKVTDAAQAEQMLETLLDGLREIRSEFGIS